LFLNKSFGNKYKIIKREHGNVSGYGETYFEVYTIEVENQTFQVVFDISKFFGKI
jgi:hypothetical protein